MNPLCVLLRMFLPTNKPSLAIPISTLCISEYLFEEPAFLLVSPLNFPTPTTFLLAQKNLSSKYRPNVISLIAVTNLKF